MTTKIYRRSKPKTASGFEYTFTWTSSQGRTRSSYANEAQALGYASEVAVQLSLGRMAARERLSEAQRIEYWEAKELVGELPLKRVLGEWVRAPP